MIRFLLIVSFFAFTLSGTQAQTLYIGPKAGLNISSLSFSEGDNDIYGNKLGINAGAMLIAELNPMFGVQTELNLMNMGASFEFANEDFNLAFSYMEIPLLARAKFGDEESLQFFANGGAFLGLLLSANVVDDGDRTEVTESYNGTNFGLAFGGGVLIPAGMGKIILDARYGLGISDISDSPASSSEVRTRNFGITAGFLIDL